jgi:hypothetical protein
VPDPAVTALAAAAPPGNGVDERLLLPGWLPDGFKAAGQRVTDANHYRMITFLDPSLAPRSPSVVITFSPESNLPSSPAQMATLLGFSPDEPVQPTSVRGHDGVLATSASAAATGFVWVEHPGQVVAVVGARVDASTLQRFIENLQSVTAAEWQATSGLSLDGPKV